MCQLYGIYGCTAHMGQSYHLRRQHMACLCVLCICICMHVTAVHGHLALICDGFMPPFC